MYKRRMLEESVLTLSKENKIILLTGARQVGKSTLLKQLFPNLSHITFDPIQDLYGAREDPDLFLKGFKSPIILDEVQYVPELLASLKRFVDKHDQKGQYFLTGSQNFLMMKEVSESMAGRVGILNLFPMNFLEMYDQKRHWVFDYLKRDPNFYKNLKEVKLPSIFECIWKGGMPGLINRNIKTIPNYFESYLKTYIERDIRTAAQIQNIQNFTLFTRLLSANTSQEVNFAHLGREIGISNTSAISWKTILQMTYFWLEIPAFHKNALKRIAAKPKGYIMDTGLACFLKKITSPQGLIESPSRGSLFETYCVNQFYSILKSQLNAPEFYHWRTMNHAEIDLVLEQDGCLFPIEFKCKTTLSVHDARWFKSFKETYPTSHIFKGVIVYTGDTVRFVTDDVIAIPWNFLPTE
jgi:predicted AAA+ superfamily ATPase